MPVKIVITFISFYQEILSGLIKNMLGIPLMCRFSPTCSAYAKESIAHQGLLKGGYVSMVRFLSCHPFSKHQ